MMLKLLKQLYQSISIEQLIFIGFIILAIIIICDAIFSNDDDHTPTIHGTQP